jgi:hypothetical protein
MADVHPTSSGALRMAERMGLLCDILLRLPLSIFVKVVNITYFIEGLNEFLQHPVKQHLLLPHLPLELRQGLIYARSLSSFFFKYVALEK